MLVAMWVTIDTYVISNPSQLYYEAGVPNFFYVFIHLPPEAIGLEDG